MKRLRKMFAPEHLGLMMGFVYFASYLTRKNFDAVLVEIISKEGMAKTQLSVIATGLFICYGLGQLFSGYLGDKASPQRLIFIGLMSAAVLNALMPVMIGVKETTVPALVVWCLNGFAQAMLWPPIVRILAMKLPQEKYSRATVAVSRGGMIGNLLIYLLAPVCIRVSGWKPVFYIAAGIAALVALLFEAGTRLMEESGEANKTDEKDKAGAAAQKPVFPRYALLALIPIMLSIIMQGMLKDGISTWMPTCLSEIFHLGSELSILSGVLLPLFSLVSYEITLKMHQKLFRNEMTCSGIIFLCAAVCAVLLRLFCEWNAILTTLLFTILTGCMHGVNLLLTTILTRNYASTGRVAAVSGVLNFSSYIGSSASIYGIAYVTEKSGWNGAMLIWMVTALAGTALCIACARNWEKTREKLNA